MYCHLKIAHLKLTLKSFSTSRLEGKLESIIPVMGKWKAENYQLSLENVSSRLLVKHIWVQPDSQYMIRKCM